MKKTIFKDAKRDKNKDRRKTWRDNKKAKKELFYAINVQG